MRPLFNQVVASGKNSAVLKKEEFSWLVGRFVGLLVGWLVWWLVGLLVGCCLTQVTFGPSGRSWKELCISQRSLQFATRNVVHT